MALGEEVGDAYISVHANTSPFRRELAAMRTATSKDLKAMEKDAQRFSDSLDDATNPRTGKTRLAQLRDAMHDVQLEGGVIKRRSGKWISPELGKSIDAAVLRSKELQRVLRDTFAGKKLDTKESKDALRSFEEQVRLSVLEMGHLGVEAKKVSKTMEDDYVKSMDKASERTLIVKNRTTELRTTLTKMQRAAKSIGDDDFAAKLDSRMRTLHDRTKQYEMDLVGVEKGSKEWHDTTLKLQRSLNGLTTAVGEDNKELDVRLTKWREMSDVQEQAIRENKDFDRAMSKSKTTVDKHRQSVARWTKETEKANKKGNIFTRTFSKMGGRIGSSFRRMDSTVRLVIGLIAVAGNAVAALGSGLSAGLVAVAGAAALALVALSPLIGVLAPLALGVLAAVAGFKDLKKYAPQAANALEGLKKQFSEVAVPALMKEWGKSLTGFFDSLKQFLGADVFSGIGKAFGKITDSISAVLSGDVGKQFKEALAGPLTEALGILGSSLGPLLSTLLQFFTAAAPFAVILSKQFLAWAENLEKAFSESIKSGKFESFMTLAIDALDSLLGLLGSVGDALGTVFEAGAPTGIILLDMLNKMVTIFNDWANSLEGQTALKDWFDSGLKVMQAVFDLIGDLGLALADLVTPEVVDDLVQLLGGLGDILPVLGDIISIIGQAHILDLFTEALVLIGAAIEPLIEPFSNFLAILSDELLGVMESLTPSFEDIGTALGDLFVAITPLLPVLGELVTAFIDALAPILPTLTTAFINLVVALVPFISQLVDELVPILPQLSDLLLVVINFLADSLPIALQFLTPLLDNFITLFPTLNDLVIALIPLFEAIVDLLVDLTPLFEGLAAMMNVNVTMFTGIINGVMTAITWYTKFAVKVQSLEQAFIDFIKNNPILKWWEDLLTKGTGAFDGLEDAVKSFGKAVLASIKGTFNGIARIWNATVGKLEWTVPSWVPGIGGNKIGAPDIPIWNAAGGIATKPTIAGFGEAGPEALVPLNRPLSQVDPSVRGLSAIAQGLGGAGMNISEGAIVINTPATNGKVIAESVLDRLVSYSR